MNQNIKVELKVEVAKLCHLFWEKHLTTGNDGGDISLRDPETGYIYICPRANERHVVPNWGMVSPQDIVVVDIEGNVLEDTWMLPTVEASMHYKIYKARPEINAIVHSHAVFSSVVAAVGENIPPCLIEAAFIGGEVVCAEYGKVGSQLLADNIVRALGDKKKAALLRNHGAVAIGKTMREAFTVSDYMEKIAKVAMYAKAMGSRPVSLDVEDIKDENLI